MDEKVGNLGFGPALAQSRTVQGVLRALNLFGEKYPGVCTLVFKRVDENGVEVDFGTAHKRASKDGLDDFLSMVTQTDELMLLEAMVSNLRDRGADPALVAAFVDEAAALVEKLYPKAKFIAETDNG